jgi:hypothetical protein
MADWLFRNSPRLQENELKEEEVTGIVNSFRLSREVVRSTCGRVAISAA